jgi:hypothetical protein
MKALPQNTPTEAKHTPGPWAAHGCAVYTADNWSEGRNLGGLLVAVASPAEADSQPQDEDLANARLIAAAPELLEALLLVERAWTGDGVDMGTAIDSALLAIAKATQA